MRSKSLSNHKILSLLTGGFAAIFALLILFFIFAGQINQDEGFYLLAGKLVYEGKLPYRDFHYTQMPLLPYVYGLPQLILGNSLYVGRFTSVFLLVMSFVVTVKVARLLAGAGSAVWIALLLGTNWWFIYLGTITKTHALVYVLIALSVYVCAKEIYLPQDDVKSKALLLILGTVLAGVAVLVRLPSVPFAAVAFGYTTFRLAQLGRRWVMLNTLALLVVGGVAAAFAAAAGWDVFLFNNVGSHWHARGEPIAVGGSRLVSFIWGALNTGSTIKALLGAYSSVFPIELLIISVAVVFHDWMARRRSSVNLQKQKSQLMLAVSLTAVMLAASPILRDVSQTDYYVISFPCAALVVAIAFSKVSQLGLSNVKLGRWLLILLVLVSGYHLLRYSTPSLQRLGVVRVNGVVKLPLNYLREVASFLKEHRRDDGSMLTTYGYLAYEAGLPLIPGLEMEGFSCQEMPDSLVQRYRMVNIESVVSLIASHQAEYVVVSRGPEPLQFGWCSWTPEAADRAMEHLQRHYSAIGEFENFGKWKDQIVIYQRNGDGDLPR